MNLPKNLPKNLPMNAQMGERDAVIGNHRQ
jgi:hypothetical protein